MATPSAAAAPTGQKHALVAAAPVTLAQLGPSDKKVADTAIGKLAVTPPTADHKTVTSRGSTVLKGSTEFDEASAASLELIVKSVYELPSLLGEGKNDNFGAPDDERDSDASDQDRTPLAYNRRRSETVVLQRESPQMGVRSRAQTFVQLFGAATDESNAVSPPTAAGDAKASAAAKIKLKGSDKICATTPRKGIADISGLPEIAARRLKSEKSVALTPDEVKEIVSSFQTADRLDTAGKVLEGLVTSVRPSAACDILDALNSTRERRRLVQEVFEKLSSRCCMTITTEYLFREGSINSFMRNDTVATTFMSLLHQKLTTQFNESIIAFLEVTLPEAPFDLATGVGQQKFCELFEHVLTKFTLIAESAEFPNDLKELYRTTRTALIRLSGISEGRTFPLPYFFRFVSPILMGGNPKIPIPKERLKVGSQISQALQALDSRNYHPKQNDYDFLRKIFKQPNNLYVALLKRVDEALIPPLAHVVRPNGEDQGGATPQQLLAAVQARRAAARTGSTAGVMAPPSPMLAAVGDRKDQKAAAATHAKPSGAATGAVDTTGFPELIASLSRKGAAIGNLTTKEIDICKAFFANADNFDDGIGFLNTTNLGTVCAVVDTWNSLPIDSRRVLAEKLLAKYATAGEDPCELIEDLMLKQQKKGGNILPLGTIVEITVSLFQQQCMTEYRPELNEILTKLKGTNYDLKGSSGQNLLIAHLENILKLLLKLVNGKKLPDRVQTVYQAFRVLDKKGPLPFITGFVYPIFAGMSPFFPVDEKDKSSRLQLGKAFLALESGVYGTDMIFLQKAQTGLKVILTQISQALEMLIQPDN